MTLEEFARKAVGVPFVDGGRDYTGWDCYGELYVAYRDVLGIEIPAYRGAYKTAKQVDVLTGISEHELRTNWSKVERPQPMDGILIRIDGRPVHVGLVLDRRHFLHVDRGVQTCVQDYKSFEWGLRVLGFYRLAERPQALMAS